MHSRSRSSRVARRGRVGTTVISLTRAGRCCVLAAQGIAMVHHMGDASCTHMASEANNFSRDSQPEGSGKKAVRRANPDDAIVSVERSGDVFSRVREHVQEASTHLDEARGLLSRGSVLNAACVKQTQQALAEAASKLDGLSELVHASMQSRATSLGSVLLQRARPVTLSEAADHASDVLLPIARQHSITLDVRCAKVCADEPARALYTVLLNTMTNAIEAVIARGADPTSLKTVHVEIGPCPPPRVRGKVAASGTMGVPAGWIAIDVTDDGVGLPGHIPSQRLCELGVTTKPGAGGVGLAVARSIVRGMGGDITITSRPSGTRGAMLRAVFPAAVAVARNSA